MQRSFKSSTSRLLHVGLSVDSLHKDGDDIRGGATDEDGGRGTEAVEHGERAGLELPLACGLHFIKKSEKYKVSINAAVLTVGILSAKASRRAA